LGQRLLSLLAWPFLLAVFGERQLVAEICTRPKEFRAAEATPAN
jgi:hypothetical protein